MVGPIVEELANEVANLKEVSTTSEETEENVSTTTITTTPSDYYKLIMFPKFSKMPLDIYYIQQESVRTIYLPNH